MFEELSPKRTEVCRRKSIIRDPGRKSIGANRKTVSFGSLPTELTVRSAKDCLKHMYSVRSIQFIQLLYLTFRVSLGWTTRQSPVGESRLSSILLAG